MHSEKTACLYPNYGTSDILQSFSRISSVYQTIFIINNHEMELSKIKLHKTSENDPYAFSMTSNLVPEGKTLRAKKIIASEQYDQLFSHITNPDRTPPRTASQLRGILIYNIEACEEKVNFPQLLILHPESCGNQNPIHVLFCDTNSISCPRGRMVVYVS